MYRILGDVLSQLVIYRHLDQFHSDLYRQIGSIMVWSMNTYHLLAYVRKYRHLMWSYTLEISIDLVSIPMTCPWKKISQSANIC